MRLQSIALLSLFLTFTCEAQWFNEQSLRCTVLIEKWQDTAFVPHGAGFVVHNERNPKRPIVVTAGHLLNRSELYVSVNADSSLLAFAKAKKADTLTIFTDKLPWLLSQRKLRARVRLLSTPVRTYLVHPTIDVGAFQIDIATRGEDETGKPMQIAEFMVIRRSQMRLRNDVALGDELYFVGFPFGIGAADKLEPLVRSGSVAWLSPASHEFLLDALSFGGNSGSPIFSKIILGRKRGMIAWDTSALVGIVVGHLGDNQHNYGLARGIWIDHILPLIDQASRPEIVE